MPRTQIREIPINGPYHANVDDDAVVDPRTSLLQDRYVDELGASNPRPGAETHNDTVRFGSPMQGDYEWKQKGYYMFVQGGKLFAQKGDSADPVEVTGATLEVTGRPTWAYNGEHLVVANGGKMVITADGTTCAFITDGNAPTKVSHVDFIDGYIIANDADTDKVWRSKLDDAEVWNASWFFEAESVPDTVTALKVSDSKIYAYGPTTLEIWYNAGLSGGTPFARQQVIERGIIAPDSLIRANNTFYWLNEERRLVFLNGTIAQSVSLPVDRSFNDMTTVSDAFSMLWRVGGKYFVVIVFPTEDKSWAYDVILDRWYPWGFWNTGTGKYQRIIFNSMTYMQNWGIHIAGSRRGDILYKMSLTVYADGDDNIRGENRSGWVDHGLSNIKKSKRLRLTTKRGAVMLDTSDLDVKPKLIIQFRDNGNREWSVEREVDMGQLGDAENIIELNRFGLYRSRQWRFVMSDKAPFILIKVEEFFEVGRN